MNADNSTASSQPSNQYYRTPAQVNIEGVALYENPSPRVSPPKPRVDGRKKFTAEQTLRMETLFRENTHPPREQRHELANLFNVNEKSVGIWFQNRRQAVRRDRKLAPSKSMPLPASRPSLERVASEIELPPPKPRSVFDASYHRDHTAHIWGHMISSSPSPPASPNRTLPHMFDDGDSSPPKSGSPSRTRSASPTRRTPRLAQGTMVRTHSNVGVQRTRLSTGRTRVAGRVTLEWACANAKRLPSSPLRPSDETPKAKRETRGTPKSTVDGGMDQEDDTEAEADARTEVSEETEAVTPSEGRSVASIDVASSTWSSRGSFSSDISASGMVTSRTLRRQTRDRGSPAAWLTQSSGRTIRNLNGRTLPKDVVAKGSEPVDVVPASPASAVSPSTSPNSPQEIEAALVLCGLSAFGRS